MPAKRHEPKNGLTLVEVLATTVLLGLVAATLLKSWSAPSERSQLQALAQELIALDARARIEARTGSAVSLAVDPTRHRLVAHCRCGGGLVSEVSLPADAEVALVREGVRPTNAVVFDPDGTSCDYALELRRGGSVARVDIAGLTGWTTTLEGPR